MREQELIPHLFRTEFSKICSVLSKLFGIEHIEIAEDIASDTFLSALEIWPYKGIPANPAAWLHAVAKNKTRNYLHRNRIFYEKVASEAQHEATGQFHVDLSDENITDSMLQMLFTLCHPAIAAEAQIGLSLRILCGFSIDEIATAFLTNKETINKRLFRAKQILREQKVQIAYPGAVDIDGRLNTVLTTLYLLFSEGYYSENKEEVVREELCYEAMRLTCLLTENDSANVPKVNALYALMCLHASRLPARKHTNGEIILYADQDESLWDREMISRGAYYLHKASVGNNVSKYHLEAAIAYWHTVKSDTQEKWEHVLQLYNRLLQMEYSPVAALNRTYALSRAKGKQEAIGEAEKMALTDNHFYFALLGELYTGLDNQKAIELFGKAAASAKTATDRQTMLKKRDNIRL